MSHSHPHRDRPDGPEPTGGEEMQAANRSLADALRVSFKLLAILMILLLGFLLLTGLRQVQPGQMGVKLVFGRIAAEGPGDVLGEGLHWSWPEPIGRVVTIGTRDQTLEMDDFWLFVPPADADKPLEQLRTRSEGLRPVLDGALLTGDRYLLHAKLVVIYRLGVARDPDSREDEPVGRPDGRAVLDYLVNVAPESEPRPRPAKGEPEKVLAARAREIVRTVVANAAIRTAAGQNLDYIYVGGNTEAFAKDIAKESRKHLEDMHTGIYISRVEIPAYTVPIRARAAFHAVIQARQQVETQINQAKGDAVTTIKGAAGEASSLLVGDVVAGIDTPTALSAAEPLADQGVGSTDPVQLVRRWADARERGKADETASLQRQIEQHGLLNLYAHARERKDPDADVILAEINRVLVSNEAGGAVATIISQANSYATTIRQTIAARADEFSRLIDQYEKTPTVMVERLWAQTKEDILSRPAVEKFYVSRTERLVLQLTRDPELRRRSLLRALAAGRGTPGGERK